MLNPIEKARLFWHCRRGMLELDLILHRFMEQAVDNLTDSELESFNKLLSFTDPELLSWLMGGTEPPHEELSTIVSIIRTHP